MNINQAKKLARRNRDYANNSYCVLKSEKTERHYVWKKSMLTEKEKKSVIYTAKKKGVKNV